MRLGWQRGRQLGAATGAIRGREIAAVRTQNAPRDGKP
jgi:hypothetical protein